MTAATTLTWIAAIAAAWVVGCPPSRANPPGSPGPVDERSIAFDDLAPADLRLEQCWDAVGMDSEQRVYIGFTSRRADGREDFAAFRYDPSTNARRFLGTFMGASQSAGNLRPGEQIPKGHTHMLEIDGRMYMASQGFHDLKGALDTLPTYRGSHLYAYDIARGKLEDVSRRLPEGVVMEHQGLIALAHSAGSDLLVGLAHPSSDIVLFDVRRNRVKRIVGGIPWRLGNPLSREIVATKAGKIYTYRGTEDPAQRGEVHHIWAYDLETNAMAETASTATGGFWNGQTATRDGGTIYLATVNGELYRLDVATGAFTSLGLFLPKREIAAGEQVDQLYGITLSADETRIYGIPRRHRARSSNLYAYDIASGTVELVGAVATAVYAGSDLRDTRGNIYFGRFGTGTAFDGKARLAVVHPPGPTQ
ncbi:MAG: PQQ-like beta-propeller repeat protein [Proteobacteria bacterium]|nr:PQQ-like beta-propeller repeat protein [Pseudomonadota bacterium]